MKVKDLIERDVQYHYEHLRGVIETASRLTDKLGTMLEEDVEGSVDIFTTSVSLTLYETEDGGMEHLAKTVLGVKEFKAQFNGTDWSKWGEAKVNGTSVRVNIMKTDAPQNCELIKKTNTYTYFEVKCDEVK